MSIHERTGGAAAGSFQRFSEIFEDAVIISRVAELQLASRDGEDHGVRRGRFVLEGILVQQDMLTGDVIGDESDVRRKQTCTRESDTHTLQCLKIQLICFSLFLLELHYSYFLCINVNIFLIIS